MQIRRSYGYSLHLGKVLSNSVSSIMKRDDATEVYNNQKRFAFTDEDVASITTLKSPTTTTHATQWALRNFQDRMQSRNATSSIVPLETF